MAAIANEGAYCFDYIENKALREKDRDVVLALVAADGSLLERISDEELRADREVVRVALATSADSLKFASKNLQSDRELKALAAAQKKREERFSKEYSLKGCGPRCLPR